MFLAGKPYSHLVYEKPVAVFKKTILKFYLQPQKTGINKSCLRKTFWTPEVLKTSTVVFQKYDKYFNIW